MSYCVHCGVRLAPSEKNCPLCGTEVINPSAPWQPPEKMPYPDRVQDILRRIDLRYGQKLALLLVLMPSLVVAAVNLLADGSTLWSLYVVGALACLYTWIAVPFFCRMKRPYLYMALDFVMLAAYVLLIALLAGGAGWYFALALPLIAAVALYCTGVGLAVRRVEWAPLVRAALVHALTALLLLALEYITDRFMGAAQLGWSVYAGLPLAVLAAMCLTVEKKKGLKERVRKHLFI